MTTGNGQPTYPWDGGDYMTDIRIFEEGEPDEEGVLLAYPMIGLGDYVDEGAPDLHVMFPPGTSREHVQWVHDALVWRMADPPQGCTEGVDVE